jgi:hypothetical protein
MGITEIHSYSKARTLQKRFKSPTSCSNFHLSQEEDIKAILHRTVFRKGLRVKDPSQKELADCTLKTRLEYANQAGRSSNSATSPMHQLVPVLFTTFDTQIGQPPVGQDCRHK